jgi:hypothetical protein
MTKEAAESADDTATTTPAKKKPVDGEGAEVHTPTKSPAMKAKAKGASAAKKRKLEEPVEAENGEGEVNEAESDGQAGVNWRHQSYLTPIRYELEVNWEWHVPIEMLEMLESQRKLLEDARNVKKP